MVKKINPASLDAFLDSGMQEATQQATQQTAQAAQNAIQQVPQQAPAPQQQQNSLEALNEGLSQGNGAIKHIENITANLVKLSENIGNFISPKTEARKTDRMQQDAQNKYQQQVKQYHNEKQHQETNKQSSVHNSADTNKDAHEKARQIYGAVGNMLVEVKKARPESTVGEVIQSWETMREKIIQNFVQALTENSFVEDATSESKKETTDIVSYAEDDKTDMNVEFADSKSAAQKKKQESTTKDDKQLNTSKTEKKSSQSDTSDASKEKTTSRTDSEE